LIASENLTASVLTNLAFSANAAGDSTGGGYNQGTDAGIYNGQIWRLSDAGWAGTSPRYFFGTQIEPWMTWASPQSIREVVVYGDAGESISTTSTGRYSRLIIDTLNTGGNPNVAGDWTQVYDSGPGVNVHHSFIDLGTNYVTSGLRVRASKDTVDIDIGEVAVFSSPFGSKVIPSSVTASSTYPGYPSAIDPAYAANGRYTDFDIFYGNKRWISAAPGSNPGTDYTFTLNFSTPTNLNQATLAFIHQTAVDTLPSSWMLEYSSGAGYTTVENGSPILSGTGIDSFFYYYEFATITNVTAFRLTVPESALPGSEPHVGLREFEVFYVPEPGMATLVAFAAIVLRSRQRKA
jgi:hypothetical protein